MLFLCTFPNPSDSANPLRVSASAAFGILSAFPASFPRREKARMHIIPKVQGEESRQKPGHTAAFCLLLFP